MDFTSAGRPDGRVISIVYLCSLDSSKGDYMYLVHKATAVCRGISTHKTASFEMAKKRRKEQW